MIKQPKVSIRQFLTDNIDKYETAEELIAKCVKTLKVTKGSVNDKWRKHFRGKSKAPSTNEGQLKRAINGEEFRKQQDLTIKVNTALKKLGRDVIWDADFRTELHITPDKWKRIVQKIDPEEKYRLKIQGKYIWGQPDVLKKIEETIDIL